nr:hypothetical protein GCM10020185_13320 [Pseudomonas brassicacearum subsp. brassicacearum]
MFDLEQLGPHALIAQRNAAVDGFQLHFQARQALGLDLTVQHQETLDLGNIAVFLLLINDSRDDSPSRYQSAWAGNAAQASSKLAAA